MVQELAYTTAPFSDIIQMNILLTNDDGIDFPGIQSLFDTLSGRHTPYIFAPAMEKSATSKAMTLFEDIYVKNTEERKYIVNGFPVDCVNIALHGGILDVRFDLVISGINKGVNMGQDVLYSGTVGAAMHAYLHNYPAIAVSCGYLDREGDFNRVADFINGFIDQNSDKFNQKMLLNINYPVENNFKEQIKWTKLGQRIYRDTYKKAQLDTHSMLVNLGGSELGYKEEEGTDFEAYFEGNISVTPLKYYDTDYETRDRFG